MLQVTYEAVDDLGPGRLAWIDEDRGKIHIKVDGLAPLPKVIAQLNVEMALFLARADWYQLWDDEILSRHTPGRPIRAEFTLVPHPGPGVGIAEDRGVVRIYVADCMTTTEFAASMNPAVQDFLDGGCWFQLYAGEIIDHSPGPMSQV
ncbi:hypothetical protein ACFWIO_35730 [Streptomyces diastatochromogenes]|uniref:hypothetical protein n=1 Tax=Streptomyces diastatochromogenes TaxID=42236 RepID=UPI00365B06A4